MADYLGFSHDLATGQQRPDARMKQWPTSGTRRPTSLPRVRKIVRHFPSHPGKTVSQRRELQPTEEKSSVVQLL